MLPKIQYISQGDTENEQVTNIQKALDAGIEWVQLRFKDKGENSTIKLAEKIKKLTEPYNCLYIINDSPLVALKSEADGVHLGLTDLSINEARKILGPEYMIGGTANTLEEMKDRIMDGCNYIGLGPYRFTDTKKNLSPILGLEGYENRMRTIQDLPESIPVFAIGGIQLEDVSAILRTGVYGIAVSGLLSGAIDPERIIKELKQLTYATF